MRGKGAGEGVNSLKGTYVEGWGGGGTCKANRNEQGGGGEGIKNWKFPANVLFE